MPYAVSRVIESKLHYSFHGVYRAQTQIRFSAFAVGHDMAAGLMDVLTGEFDDRLFTLSSGMHVSTTRLDDPVPKLHKHDGEGNDVWEVAVVYEYGVNV